MTHTARPYEPQTLQERIDDTLSWYVEMWKQRGFRAYAEQAIADLAQQSPELSDLPARFKERTDAILAEHRARKRQQQEGSSE